MFWRIHWENAFVDLSTGQVREEILEEKTRRDFIGGYGIGEEFYIVDRSRGRPLGPENTFGLISGPLTGTLVPMGARYMAVAKSPLTGVGEKLIPVVTLVLISNSRVLMPCSSRGFRPNQFIY